MHKATQVFVLTMTLVLSIVSFATAQNTADIIENIGVIRIESVEVYPTDERAVHHLNIVAELKNDNEKDLKLTETDFEFFIQDVNNPDYMINIGEADCIYNLPDTAPSPFVLEPDWTCEGGQTDDILLEAQQARRVLFAVEMGRDKLSVLETTIHILNFLGKPQEGRYFFIKGRFDLGIKSSKGWSYGEAIRVEWMFCPTIQNELPLHECFAGE